jgi:hypothetical protein
MRAARHEIAQRLSKARASRSAREPDYNLLDFGALENEGVAAPKECASRCYLATKEQGLKISSPFDFSFLRPAEAMHAKIHLKRVCDEMVAMILVVNPAIHLVARAPKQLLCRQRCGQEFGPWREGE